MHYQLNNFTGRLIGNVNILPYYPLNVQPLSKVEAPQPVFATANQKVAQAKPQRSLTTSASRKIPGSSHVYGDVPESLRKKMSLFQIKNSVPVHLKGGVMDRILFGSTVGLCLVGIAATLAMIYDMSYPKKKK